MLSYKIEFLIFWNIGVILSNKLDNTNKFKVNKIYFQSLSQTAFNGTNFY